MADAEQMRRRFATSPTFKVLSAVGDPPEVYQVEFRVRSVEKVTASEPAFRDTHVAEIQLTSEYPACRPSAGC